MKPNIVRYVLLAWLIGGILTIMAMPFISLISAIGVAEGFKSMLRPLFLFSILLLGWFCIGDNIIDFWRIRRSRNECRKAYHALHRYFNEHALEGFNSNECRRLHQNLVAELHRHCSLHPFERQHKIIRNYTRYCNKIEHARSVV